MPSAFLSWSKGRGLADPSFQGAAFSVDVCLLACFPHYRKGTWGQDSVLFTFPSLDKTWLQVAQNETLALPLGSYSTSQTSESRGKMMILASSCCLKDMSHVRVQYFTWMKCLFLFLTLLFWSPSPSSSGPPLRGFFSVLYKYTSGIPAP